MNKKQLRIIMMGVCVLSILTAVPLYAQQTAPNTVKIGYLDGLTGPHGTFGKRNNYGVSKAVEAINKEGGIYIKEFDKKLPIEIIQADHEANETKAVLGTEYVNQKGIVALIGTTAFQPTACGIAEKYHLPSVATVIGLQKIQEQGYRYLFSNHPKNPDFAKSFVAFLNSLPPAQRPTKVALFEEQTDLGIECIAYAQKELVAHGYKFVTTKHQKFCKDLSAQILEAKKAGADAMYGTLMTPDGLLLVKQMKQLDFSPKTYMVLMASGNRDAWRTLGKDGDYVLLGSGVFHWSFSYPGAKELSAMYEADNKEKIMPNTASLYSSVQVVADAIRRAGCLDREKIRDALATTDMMTVTGHVKFAKNGQAIYDNLPVLQYQNGVDTVIWPEKLRQKPPVYPMPKWNER